jgi:hypothetical protein
MGWQGAKEWEKTLAPSSGERFEQCVRDPKHCQTDEPLSAMIRNKLIADRIARQH